MLARPVAWHPRTAVGNPDLWLWAGAIASALAAGIADLLRAAPEVAFFMALVAIAFAATTMGRAIDQVAGRLRPGAVGLFQAATGICPS